MNIVTIIIYCAISVGMCFTLQAVTYNPPRMDMLECRGRILGDRDYEDSYSGFARVALDKSKEIGEDEIRSKELTENLFILEKLLVRYQSLWQAHVSLQNTRNHLGIAIYIIVIASLFPFDAAFGIMDIGFVGLIWIALCAVCLLLLCKLKSKSRNSNYDVLKSIGDISKYYFKDIENCEKIIGKEYDCSERDVTELSYWNARSISDIVEGYNKYIKQMIRYLESGFATEGDSSNIYFAPVLFVLINLPAFIAALIIPRP